jgi:transcriptional regulator with XRE-family HTH domain
MGGHLSAYKREFGKHVRSLRRARGVTQDALAKRSGLSADTIRRIEHGSFSASIETLRKLCSGLGVAPSTVFEGFELGRTDERRELLDLVAARSRDEIVLVTRVVRALLDELDTQRGERK